MRTTLSALVSRLRRMVGDRESETWTDDELASTLEQFRTVHSQVRVLGEPLRGESGATVYSSFAAPSKDWESGVVVQTASYASVPAESYSFSHERGVIVFNQPQSASFAFLSGSSYELVPAAISLLQEHLGELRMQVDTSDKDKSKRYGQKATATERLIARLESQLPAQSIGAVRSDVQ